MLGTPFKIKIASTALLRQGYGAHGPPSHKASEGTAVFILIKIFDEKSDEACCQEGFNPDEGLQLRSPVSR